MSEWANGYRAALGDVERLMVSRELLTKPLIALFQDMQQDALVIEHEHGNRMQKRRLAAAREVLPLFTAAENAT